MTSTPYYIEIIDNLGIVDIYVLTVAGEQMSCFDSAAKDIVNLVDASTVRISENTVVKLPVSVVVKSATRSTLPELVPQAETPAQSWLRVRAPMTRQSSELRQKDAPQLITSVAKPVSSDSLNEMQGIRCQSCGSRIDAWCGTQIPHVKQSIRELPSAYWSELVDCWVCHPEEDNINVNADLLHIFEPVIGQENTQDDDSEPGLEAPTSTEHSAQIWISETYILVPTSYLRSLPTHEVHLAEKKRFYNKYAALCCDGCGKVLGEVGRMGPKRLCKLFLHCIGFVFPEPSQTISVSLSQVFCREMLSHASAHAVYKFVVESREACKPVAIVHLVGWNAEIQAMSSCAEEKCAFEACVKVLFMAADDGGFQSRANESLEDDTTELLSLLEDDCAKLVQILKHSSLFIPPQLRTMSGLTRGFLKL